MISSAPSISYVDVASADGENVSIIDNLSFSSQSSLFPPILLAT